jgi:AcrR family transcriptional regulator
MPVDASSSRENLLEAGQKLFGAQGYAATSMREVAGAAGLALGGIYNHFSSKEDIFQTILLERNPFATRSVRSLPEPLDRQQANLLLEELARQPEFFNLVLIELLEFKGRHLPGLVEKIFETTPPPSSWRILVSLLISYHVTQTLLTGVFPPEAQAQTPPNAWLDCILTGFLNLE